MGRIATENKCEWPLCRDEARPGKKMCFMHGRIYENTPAPKPLPQPIAKKSEKMKQEDKVYKKFVAEYLSRPENKRCNIQGPNCTVIATCINHLKRRFKDTKMNEEFIEPSCSTCNVDIENNHAEAKATGHLLSKFN